MTSQVSLYEEKNKEMTNYMKRLNDIEEELTQKMIYTKRKKARRNLERLITLVQQTRENLATALGSLNYYYTTNLKTSSDTLEQQTDAVAVIDREMQLAKNRIAYINKEKNNKMRVVEINQYYGAAYQERTLLVKWIIVFFLVLVVLLTIRKFFPVIPETIMNLLFIATIGYFGYHILQVLLSLFARNRMVYDEYEWSFNKNGAPEFNEDLEATNPFELGSFATCVAQNCCNNGTTWNAEKGLCDPAGVAAGGASGNAGSAGSTDPAVSTSTSTCSPAPVNPLD